MVTFFSLFFLLAFFVQCCGKKEGLISLSVQEVIPLRMGNKQMTT